ncbi:di-trans,poly-cis-decaprenylcistransferase [Aliidiomarina taiwanensis]|uniref:Ditrans,polycis-undecaprenyl-diphosphate synthase ((2E,6E)-farnesyl-diphosphate specific) n=1 Tax=Aliidiomarina taiwanensis TaxID=946228 RepID=A0A432XAL8_9GAMM|nr:polyprenyl diphosphate synthase [Aliidiomarina taiwanensis]RUO44356.1 di-trans,poly-cis-decaprenylcistransferase [Aliidiomarina taiwanensis]
MTPKQGTQPLEGLPRHVAIIMDGNGRWAKQRGKGRTFGHKQGAESVRQAVAFARRNGIEALTLFAFSSENWGRPSTEVSVLMELFVNVLKREVPSLNKNGIQLRVVGDTSRFSRRLQAHIAKAEADTAHNTAMVLNVAANYGGRWDITQACKQLAKKVQAGEINPEDITEESLGRAVCMSDLAPIDLLIRTGGDMRVSNFLLWQIAYTEFYFANTLWPDFDDHAFAEAIDSFLRRERRFGLTSEQRQNMLADD